MEKKNSGLAGSLFLLTIAESNSTSCGLSRTLKKGKGSFIIIFFSCNFGIVVLLLSFFCDKHPHVAAAASLRQQRS